MIWRQRTRAPSERWGEMRSRCELTDGIGATFLWVGIATQYPLKRGGETWKGKGQEGRWKSQERPSRGSPCLVLVDCTKLGDLGPTLQHDRTSHFPFTSFYNFTIYPQLSRLRTYLFLGWLTPLETHPLLTQPTTWNSCTLRRDWSRFSHRWPPSKRASSRRN